jgi:broad specificity phosphatase PhoE
MTPGPQERRIVLVRHGRSAHVHTGWIDRDGFLRWREAYEAAGLDPADAPPPALRELVASAEVIVASDAPRALASARLLAPRAESRRNRAENGRIGEEAPPQFREQSPQHWGESP